LMRWEAFIDTYDPAHFNEHVHYAGDEATAARSHR
jgi:hypothetical protein